MFNHKKIGVYITGGIAAYKVPDLVRRFIKLGAEVRVAMTPSAQKFVTPFTLEVLTKYPVLTDELFNYPDPVGHIHLADWLDLAIVVPATASTIGKMANGIADNEVTSSLLAIDKPIMYIPAMNSKMWKNPATQRNIEKLRMDGHYVIEPATGFLAEGYEGKGRMPEVDEIVTAMQCFSVLNDSQLDLTNKSVLISAGGTQEAIDPVRYISNKSSGKMGFALAHIAYLAEASVTLVRTKSTMNLPILSGINVITVESAQGLCEVMHQEAKLNDIIIMAAAVSDYRMSEVAEQKIKKDKTLPQQNLTLELVENTDILASLPKEKAIVVGFAAETQNIEQYGRDKLLRKGADLIVANDVSQNNVGFGSDDNKVLLISKNETEEVELASKYEIARAILEKVQTMDKTYQN